MMFSRNKDDLMPPKRLPKPKHPEGYPDSQMDDILVKWCISRYAFDHWFRGQTVLIDDTLGCSVYFKDDVAKFFDLMA